MNTTKKSTDELHFGAFSDHDAQVDVNKRKIPERISLTSLSHQAYSAPVKKRTYTAAEVRKLMRERQGTMLDAHFAAAIGVSKSYLCDVYKGRKTPGDSILTYLGLIKRETAPFYEAV